MTIVAATTTTLGTVRKEPYEIIGRRLDDLATAAAGPERRLMAALQDSATRVLLQAVEGVDDESSGSRSSAPAGGPPGDIPQVASQALLDSSGAVKFIVTRISGGMQPQAEMLGPAPASKGGPCDPATDALGLREDYAKLQNLFAKAPGFIAVLLGPTFVFDVVNEAYQELVGHRDLIGLPVRTALPELEGQGFFELLEEVYATGKPFLGREVPIRLHRSSSKDGAERYVEFLYQPIFDATGHVIGIFCQGSDVTEQKRAQVELELANERLKLAIEGSRDAIWDWNRDTRELFISPRFTEMLGYGSDETIRRYEEWVALIHPDDRPNVMDAVEACLNGQPFQQEYRLRRKDGRWKWVLGRGTVTHRDDQGRAVRVAGAITDITQKKESDELIWHHASFCPLTGLPNRRLFRDRLDQEIRKAHRSGDRMALLFIDLDRFKEVNDLLGHDAGDLLLRQVAGRLEACVRESDTVARLGGDEFTVILTELSDEPHVEAVAGKIIASLEKAFLLDAEMAYISASIGITLYPEDGNSAETLIRNADQAMYAAKKAGRNQFCYFTRGMQEEAHRRVQLIRDLRDALPAGQLQVHFQPVVDMSSRRIVKAEALLRWDHPTLGLIEPGQFITLAEESGLINKIGDWVFKESAAWAQQWGMQQGEPFEISVNRSPMQFMADSSSTGWAGFVTESRLPAHTVAVEITEGVLLNASANIANTLLQYRDAGIHVALDDFGTGYSSMMYLLKFHIDYLKIDQSFVRDIERNAGSRTIAESIIVMAHKLGMKVIAEGIETPAQEKILREAGCDYGQGYLFSRPVSPSVFGQLLNNGRGGVGHFPNP